MNHATPAFRQSILIFTSLTGLCLLGACNSMESAWDGFTGTRPSQPSLTGGRHAPVLNPPAGAAMPPQANAQPNAQPAPAQPQAQPIAHEVTPYEHYDADGNEVPTPPPPANQADSGQPGTFFSRLFSTGPASADAARKPLAGNPHYATETLATDPIQPLAQPVKPLLTPQSNAAETTPPAMQVAGSTAPLTDTAKKEIAAPDSEQPYGSSSLPATPSARQPISADIAAKAPDVEMADTAAAPVSTQGLPAAEPTGDATATKPADSDSPHWLAVLLGKPSAEPATPPRGTEVSTSATTAAPGNVNAETSRESADAQSETLAEKPPETPAAQKNSSWLPDPFGWFSDDKTPNPDADQRSTPTPSLATVPPTPTEFQGIKTVRQQDTQALQTEHVTAQQDKQQLDAEPSQQTAQVPVELPKAPVAASDKPGTAPAANDGQPQLLGHAAEDTAPVKAAATSPQDIDLTAPVMPFDGEEKPLSSTGLEAAAPSPEPAATTARQDSSAVEATSAPVNADDSYTAIPLPASAEANRVVQPEPAAMPAPPATAMDTAIIPPAPSTATTQEPAPAAPPAMAAAPAPDIAPASQLSATMEAATMPATAAITGEPATANTASTSQPVITPAPTVTSEPVSVSTASASPAAASVETANAPVPATPVSELPALVPVNAPVASVQVQDTAANGTADAGSAALPSPQMLDEVKVLPASRYAQRAQALRQQGVSQ